MSELSATARSAGMTRDERMVIFASSLGTVFEWYDFYLVGSLAAFIGKSMFSGVNPTAAFIFALLSFAAGFAVRPIGAIFFGRLGDRIGRKYTFLVTITLMGISTIVVGLLPGYQTIGIAASIGFVAMRMAQGLALGGEYAGAATYVAEHSPNERRGEFTSWIQVTAALGMLLSLAVILVVRTAVGEESFAVWGWRIPFVFSLVLLIVSVWIRMKLHESPVFAKLKAEGKRSKAPVKEAFGNWKNVKQVLIALFAPVTGHAVVWYTAQFYTLFFLTQTLKLEGPTANVLLITALVISTPMYIVMGKLSDRIGRKPIFLTGFLLGALTFFPLFHLLGEYVNPDLAAAQQRAPIVLKADPATCALQFDPTGTGKLNSACDVAKNALAKAGVSYSNESAVGMQGAQITLGDTLIDAFVGKRTAADGTTATFEANLAVAMKAKGYPTKPDPDKVNKPMVVVILVLMMLYGVMVAAPLAATLVEMFPSRIRYTSLSLPYNVGNGWFGGFLPASVFAIVAASGNIYAGLWYPVLIAGAAFVVGLLFYRETKGIDLTQIEL